jgi:hypothetical protein
MSATIIGGNSAEFEPEIISDNGRDGITAFQFSVVGRSVSGLYLLDSSISGVPGQPSGSFRVVRRNVENIVDGLQRLKISAEGGTPSSIYYSEASYSYNEGFEPGLITLPLAQVQVQYKLQWLSPSVTVTTNSGSASDGAARGIATQIVSSMSVEILQNRPSNVNGGKRINTSDVRITGSSIEKAGGLWRVRATATKGFLPL